MSTFQIPIFIGQPGVVDTKIGAPGISSIVRTGLNIPFQNNQKVKIVSIEAVHMTVAHVSTPFLCVIKSNQIYNPIAGSRDIYFSSNSINYLEEYYLSPNFQNNENITITLENLDPDDSEEFIDHFMYFLMTLKIIV